MNKKIGLIVASTLILVVAILGSPLTFAQLEQRFDTIHGGYGRAPKFPSPHNNLFLLRYWKKVSHQMIFVLNSFPEL